MSRPYSNPDVLVDVDWMEQHLNDPGIRICEVDVDVTAYGQGHIPGAIAFDWTRELQDTVRRDVCPPEQWEKLLGASGIGNDTTVFLYGDNNNWFAAYAFWLFQLYGHGNLKLINGGRKKWVEAGKPLSMDAPVVNPVSYRISARQPELRAFRSDVEKHLDNAAGALVDVRSPQEFTGEVIAPPGMSETAQRGGHIPGAQSMPWARAVNEDGTFKSPEALEALYRPLGVTADKDVIAYCRIGERSSHTWFVLKYLLGYPRVRNYDGSWTEWGSSIGLPIER